MNGLRFRCRHCRRLVAEGKAGQQYCGRKACQAARKREWSRQKYASDEDYRLNQKASTDAWLESRGGSAAYYRDYRRRKREQRLGTKTLDSTAAVGLSGPAASEVEPNGDSTTRRQATTEAVSGAVGSVFAPSGSGFASSANRDARVQFSPIKSGIYEILPIRANKDATIVTIRMISNG